MFRSPFSMYSVTMHSGSDDTHTHSNRMMLGSFRRDMIFISFRKSFLTDRQIAGEETFQTHSFEVLSALDRLVFFPKDGRNKITFSDTLPQQSFRLIIYYIRKWQGMYLFYSFSFNHSLFFYETHTVRYNNINNYIVNYLWSTLQKRKNNIAQQIK